MEVVTSWSTLMQLAKAVGDARKSGDAAALERAQAEHDAYRDLCLKSDRMHLGMTLGQL